MQMTSSAIEVFHRLRGFMRAAALAAALIIPSGVSHAITFEFQQTGSTPAGLNLTVLLTVDDTAYLGGISLYADQWSNSDIGDVLALHLAVPGIAANLSDFVPVPPISFVKWKLDLNLSPTEKNGFIYYNNTGVDFTLAFDEDSAAGRFNTDFPGPAPCRISGVCRFEGEFVPVPEPASLTLFSVGGLAAIVFGRRRRRAVR